MYPKSIMDLIDSFKKLPGVGQKTAERYALTLLDASQEEIETFSKSLVNMKKNVQRCKKCNNLSESVYCDVCENPERDHGTICVVSNAKEVFSIERLQTYQGVYHVLDGLISTQKGIMPEHINLNSLIERSKNANEVIIALNATIEGEMTSLYISKKLEGISNVTRLAFGLPIGGQLDYADDMTLLKAFEGRNKI